MKRIIFLFGLLILTSCTYNELTVCEADNPSFSECIMPIFTDNCISCHFYENPYGIMPLTNYTEIKDKQLYKNPSIPKVVFDKKGYLLYMSRAPIPFNKSTDLKISWRQVCAYSFPKNLLNIFSNTKKKTPVKIQRKWV